eukprot:2640736-Amphidinium_carterae.1
MRTWAVFARPVHVTCLPQAMCLRGPERSANDTAVLYLMWTYRQFPHSTQTVMEEGCKDFKPWKGSERIEVHHGIGTSRV